MFSKSSRDATAKECFLNELSSAACFANWILHFLLEFQGLFCKTGVCVVAVKYECEWTNGGALHKHRLSLHGYRKFYELLEGLTHVPVNYGHAVPMHDQESVYWSMNMHSYKFGISGLGNTYYGPYEVNDHLPRAEVSRSAWDYPSTINEEPATTDSQSEGDAVMGVHAIPEECSPTHHNSNSPQVAWQDNVDPDHMTYEELLDLGEAVGTQSRGLSQDLINLLPTSKYKFKNLFSAKKARERCVVCQMRYKRGDRQIKLPCKHVYHSECITKWLSISKICPICNTEVFG